VAFSKKLPDYNARLYRDELTGNFMLYLKQQGQQEMDAIYNLQVKCDNNVELLLHVGSRSQDYRLGDKIALSYQEIVESNYTLPVRMQMIAVEQQRYQLDFLIKDENNKQVSISKNLSFSQDNPGGPTEPEPVVLPDFNMRVFSSDTSTYNMYLKQQTTLEMGDVNYRIYVEGASGDDDIELEIYFAGREELYRLGDIITAGYSEFEDNNYLLAFNIHLVESASEAYRLNFVVEDESGKKVSVTKEFKAATGS
jgi:hypothetical protein